MINLICKLNCKSSLTFIVLITAGFLLQSCSSSLNIVDKPISFSKERIDLTREYEKKHYGIIKNNISILPKIIVLHWTAINSFQKSFDTFNQEKLEGSRPYLANAGQVNVAIQFLVDKDGEVYRLMPETKMARHVIGINYCSIGVENVGGAKDVDDLTDDQIDANIKLVRYLVKKFPTIEYLIGHYEYREFEGHPLWKEIDSTYRTEKFDPGERFMNAVRKGVSDLHLKGVEQIREEKKNFKPNI